MYVRLEPYKVPKNWCFWTVVLQKTLESLLDCKEIQPVNPKGNDPWIFIGRTDAEVEVKSLLIRKHPDAMKDWRQEENVMVQAWVGKEFPDMKQNERENKVY